MRVALPWKNAHTRTSSQLIRIWSLLPTSLDLAYPFPRTSPTLDAGGLSFMELSGAAHLPMFVEFVVPDGVYHFQPEAHPGPFD